MLLVRNTAPYNWISHDFLVTSKDLKTIVLSSLKAIWIILLSLLKNEIVSLLLVCYHSQGKSCERRKSHFLFVTLFSFLRIVVIDGNVPDFVLSYFIVVSLWEEGYGLAKQCIFHLSYMNMRGLCSDWNMMK